MCYCWEKWLLLKLIRTFFFSLHTSWAATTKNSPVSFIIRGLLPSNVYTPKQYMYTIIFSHLNIMQPVWKYKHVNSYYQQNPMSCFLILQFEENEKSHPVPPFRGRSLGSHSECSAGNAAFPLVQCKQRWYKWNWIRLFSWFFGVKHFFAVLFQMYEVAVSAQNAERVKLVSFDGSLGYLHNGLYRDPHLPDIVQWENI